MPGSWLPVPHYSMAIAGALGCALMLPTAGHACSKTGLVTHRSPTTAHFIGTAIQDTMFAGRGNVEYVVATGHSGAGVSRPIFGQLVSVERIGGLASRALRQVRQVVLVPWDYGADCTPTPWTRSAAWVATGERGLFTAELRDSAHWAGGLPTFDVFAPEFEPYQQKTQTRPLRRAVADSMVPIDELFQLMELFPDVRLLPDSADFATEALFMWARANPALAQRFPISHVVALARFAVGRQRLRAIRSPLTGTYRMTMSFAGRPAREFYLRTRGMPDSEFTAGPRRSAGASDDLTYVPPVEGYYLLVAVAESLTALPRDCAIDRDMDREGYIAVLHTPSDSAARRLSGKIDLDVAQSAFPGDLELERFARDETYYRRSPAGLARRTPASFSRGADGTITVEQTLTLDDGRTISFTGVRLSPDVVACRW